MATEISGLPKNTAAALSYLAWWVTGLIFLLTSKDEFVRFHAMQSTVVFGALSLAMMVPVVGRFLATFLGLVGFVLWLVLIIKAYKGEEWEVPELGKLARQLLKQSKISV